uniref:Uncharacterized protein n=1 Tax=Meloidogyne enterolobii TaxID=390850 RepID=A0A6V7WB87_MELEN|nr:unnamed protein product [Meloidogyne enterolobii]
MFGDYEERKIATWEELNKRFNYKQRKELDQIGYSMLTKDQLKFLYGPKSPFNDSVTLERLLPLTESLTINQIIERDIKKISQMSSFNIRQHDVVVRIFIVGKFWEFVLTYQNES